MVTKIMPRFRLVVAANVAIVAKIGPVHGVQIIPREQPVKKPPLKPFLFCDCPKRPERRLSVPSSTWENAGIIIENPIITRIITAKRRITFGSTPKSCTRYEILKINTEKLAIIPSVMPRDFDFPPLRDEERTIGRIGQIHGARIVTKPEMNAKRRRTIIFYTIANFYNTFLF